MEDKLGWMYGMWIVISLYKSVQAIGRLIDYHRAGVPLPANNVLLAVFWTVAVIFYVYVMWRRWNGRSRRKVS